MTDRMYMVAADTTGQFYVVHAYVYQRIGPYATAREAEVVRAELSAAAVRSAH